MKNKQEIKKGTKDRIVTESILEEKLEKFATKTEMENWAQQIVQDLSDLQDVKWEENDREWEQNDRRWQGTEVKLDKIIGMLENWKVENTVGVEQTRRLRVDVDNHEKRLKIIEASKN